MHQSERFFCVTVTIVTALTFVGCSARTTPALPSLENARVADFGMQVAQYVRAQEALAADDFDGAQNALANLTSMADDSAVRIIRIQGRS